VSRRGRFVKHAAHGKCVERFSTRILKIGANPYVPLPPRILRALFRRAGRSTSPIPVRGRVQGTPFQQTLVRYQGAWRLYLNTPMRRAAHVDVGDTAAFELEFDPTPPTFALPSAFAAALARTPAAQASFQALTPSRRKEIVRYLGRLKRPETLERNIATVVAHLVGARPKAPPAYLRAPKRPASTKRRRRRPSTF